MQGTVSNESEYQIVPPIYCMQYINPYRLFNINTDILSTSLLMELKQRIEDEFATFNVSEQVTFNGTKLLKKELFQLIEELKNPIKADFHRKITENHELYNFLEYGHLNYLHHRAQYAENPELMAFIAPYFAFQYSETLVQTLKTLDKDTLELLAGQSLPEVEGDSDTAYYQTTAQYVDNTLCDLKALQEDGRLIYMSERELISHLPDKTIELYNLLPDYFSEARNMIGQQVGVLSEALLRDYGRRDGAIALINQALQLKLSAELTQKLQEFKKILKPGMPKVPLYIGIAIGVIGLLFLIRWLEQTFF